MKDTRSILSLIVLFILMGGTAFAQIPRTITYQGSLNQAGSGTPVNGSVQITCTLYDALTGGTELWTEAHSSVSVEHGIYSIILGTVTPLDTLAFDQPYYLELTIDGELLTPRQPLTSVPYALRAARVDDIVVSETYGIKNIRIPLFSNGFFQVGDVDMATLTLQGDSLNLYGASTSTYYPRFSLGNGDQRAMYLWGDKNTKSIVLNLDNDHHLELRGPSLGFNTNHSRFEISSDEVERVMDLKITYGAGMTISGYNGDVGLFVKASNGSVGINTTNPQYELDVAGTIRGNNVSPSDIRWKKAITPCDDALERVTQLQGVTFQWKDPSRGEGPQIGIIAQDVEQVFPEVVSTDSEGYKSIDYDKLVAPLIEAVKELKAENEALKAENIRIKEEFRRRLTAIEAAINQ
jgi:hypothetical protein